ncbi:MAG: winged helix-turn-helix transcriptional regulator [Nitrospirae bacterium]|nr:MAG: winged helix-turn-helix transcriptional regulator [Nitrospirota bacterium]
MITAPLQFLRPTKLMRELFVLLALEETSNLSQHQLAKKVGVSSAMSHNYMKDLIDQGVVSVSGQTNRNMKYVVTAKGTERRVALMGAYSKEIASLYSIAKQEVERRLWELHREGLKSVVLFGAAETGELVYSAAKTTPIRILGFVDNDATKHRMLFGKIPVSSPDTIEAYQPDGVLIASSGETDAIYRQLRHLSEKGVSIVTL